MCRDTKEEHRYKRGKKNLKRRKSRHGKIVRHDSNKPHWEKVQTFTLLITLDPLSVNSEGLTMVFMHWHGLFYTYEDNNEKRKLDRMWRTFTICAVSC